MDLQLVRHFWGVDPTPGYTSYLDSWQKVGYSAFETGAGDLTFIKEFKKSSGWDWIAQVYSPGPVPSLEEHVKGLREAIKLCLGAEPLFINAHSGADFWSISEKIEFYGKMLELEEELGVTICHETHRGRSLFTPWDTHDVLKAHPQLKLVVDFSHWVCVSERLLVGCEESIEAAARQAYYLHARVGYEQGPQVPDPRVEEYRIYLESHEKWWDKIWKFQSEAGRTSFPVAPEFGPPHYMHTDPQTGKPLADLAEICDWMALRLNKRFSS
ncbi:MAG: sugar phosphate isomerase/epimerase [Verrucomicrobiota bacterium]